MPFTPLGLDHIVLRVRDQQAAQRFYVERLGCKLDHVNEKLSLIHLRFGEHFIDLLPGERTEGGVDHFCLSIRCDDLERVATELRTAGIELQGAVAPRYGAYGDGPSLYLRDPDGYMVELKPR